jgi:hypothetical protein
MRAWLDKEALLFLWVGLWATLAAAGCTTSLPDCSPDQAQTREGGGYADRLLCPDECDPSTGLGPVSDLCGVFVSASGDDGNEGTKENPVRTTSKAVELWKAKSAPPSGRKPAIYLCGETLTEATGAMLPGGVTVFGSLDCNATGEGKWRYTPGDPARETVLTAPEGQVPLSLQKSTDKILISDVHILAKTATTPGVSSIAVIADRVEATFVRSTLEAGDGAAGKAGDPYPDPAQIGVMGNSGKVACDSMSVNETPGPTNTCGPNEVSQGGVGGQGGMTAGVTGSEGMPVGMSNSGGAGESAATSCQAGGDGAPGMPGAEGANASGLGKLDPSKGYIGNDGQDGQPGTIGQGGGGGGGTRAGPTNANKCPQMMGSGASGGSGGAGGCGGAGGRKGGAAGSSIGVVSLNSKLTFIDSPVKVGNGGAPGMGGAGQVGGMGQPGGAGGASAHGISAGCNGGKGGDGGQGGKGGNGLGGHVIGVAYTVAAPARDDASVIDLMGEKGEGALKVEVQGFPP